MFHNTYIGVLTFFEAQGKFYKGLSRLIFLKKFLYSDITKMWADKPTLYGQLICIKGDIALSNIFRYRQPPNHQ